MGGGAVGRPIARGRLGLARGLPPSEPIAQAIERRPRKQPAPAARPLKTRAHHFYRQVGPSSRNSAKNKEARKDFANPLPGEGRRGG